MTRKDIFFPAFCNRVSEIRRYLWREDEGK
jgi:hypothetical protein